MKPEFFAVALVLLVPFSLAGFTIDCSKAVGGLQGQCQEIVSDGSLSEAQKDELYLGLFETKWVAPYDFVWNWNTQLHFTAPPSGVQTASDGIIRGAWVKVIGIDKSYLDLNSGTWFVEPSGRVLSDYGYSVELPSGTAPGDCSTNYSYKVLGENISQSLNGNSIGSGKIVSYSTGAVDGASMGFGASLGVSALLTIDHYKLRRHCKADDEDKCTESCDYDGSEEQQSNVSTSDVFGAKARVQSIGFSGFLEKNPGLSKIIVDLSSKEPINGFVLESGGQSFSLSEASFSLNHTGDGVVFVEKKPEESRRVKGFYDLNITETRKIVLGTVSPGPCTCVVYSDFSEKQLDCLLKELAPAVLSVEADGNHFDGNETVGVVIRLSSPGGAAIPGKSVLVKAGNEAKEVTTNDSGEATTSVDAGDSMGLISASFAGSDEYAEAVGEKRFSVGNPEAWGSGGEVVGFFGAYYMVFLIGKKLLLGAL